MKKILQLCNKIFFCQNFIQLTMKSKLPFRDELGTSQLDMAMLLGISQPLWALFEDGKRMLPAETLKRLTVLRSALKKFKQPKTAKSAQEKQRKARENEVLDTLKKDTEWELYELDRQIASQTKRKDKEEKRNNLLEFLKTKEGQALVKDGTVTFGLPAKKETTTGRGKNSDLFQLQLKKELLENQLRYLESRK